MSGPRLPSDVSTVINQTIKGKIAQNSNPASSMEKEAVLVEDKYSIENIYFDNSQFGDCYEYKENGKVCVRCRLKASVQFWKDIDAFKFIIDTFNSGYKIPFYSSQQGRFSKNNNSALQEDKFERGGDKRSTGYWFNLGAI